MTSDDYKNHALELIRRNKKTELNWEVCIEFNHSILFFVICWDQVARRYAATHVSNTREQLLLDTVDYFLLCEKLKKEFSITVIRNVRGTPPLPGLQTLLEPTLITCTHESISDENSVTITVITTEVR